MLERYRVFEDTSHLIGSLYDKQNSIKIGTIREKVFDNWGERATLFHSLDKIVRTMKDLKALKKVKYGDYTVNKVKVGTDFANLIVMTSLSISNKLYLSLDDINNNKTLFPFDYNVSIGDLNDSYFSVNSFGGETTISFK